MPKYFFQVSYTAEGTKGLLKDGGSKRRAHVEGLIKGLGGKVESFYYAFGETDVLGIVDLPDHVSIAALSLAVIASAAVNLKVTVLLTPEEIDQATKKSINYRPPGH